MNVMKVTWRKETCLDVVNSGERFAMAGLPKAKTAALANNEAF